MTDDLHGESICPSCGKMLDAATALEDGGIKPGDISICLYCGHLSALGDDNHLRPLTDEEMREVAGDPNILRVQAVRAKVMTEKSMTSHTYPPNFPPNHPDPFVRLSWALLDRVPAGVIAEQWRFYLGGQIAGALTEMHRIGKAGRDPTDMEKART